MNEKEDKNKMKVFSCGCISWGTSSSDWHGGRPPSDVLNTDSGCRCYFGSREVRLGWVKDNTGDYSYMYSSKTFHRERRRKET
jgi:hypothetical protein